MAYSCHLCSPALEVQGSLQYLQTLLTASVLSPSPRSPPPSIASSPLFRSLHEPRLSVVHVRNYVSNRTRTNLYLPAVARTDNDSILFLIRSVLSARTPSRYCNTTIFQLLVLDCSRISLSIAFSVSASLIQCFFYCYSHFDCRKFRCELDTFPHRHPWVGRASREFKSATDNNMNTYTL